jgi:hypothetical protein
MQTFFVFCMANGAIKLRPLLIALKPHLHSGGGMIDGLFDTAPHCSGQSCRHSEPAVVQDLQIDNSTDGLAKS